MGVLETLGLGKAISGSDYLQAGSSLTGEVNTSFLTGYALGTIIFFFLVAIGLYFYLSFAFMAIGRKANLVSPGVAWFSPIVTIFEVAKAHWWPMPTFLVIYLLSYLLVFLSPVLGAILLGTSLIFLLVVFHVWHWKTYEAVGRPGWWILVTTILGIIGLVLFFVGTLSIALSIIFVGILFFILTGLSYLILIGIAAWGNSNKQQNI